MTQLSPPQRGIVSTRMTLGLTLALLLVVLSVPLWLSPRLAGPSVAVRAAEGLLGARLLLEEWDTSVEVLEFGDRQVRPTSTPSESQHVDTDVPPEIPAAKPAVDQIDGDRALLLAFPAGRSVLALASDVDQRLRAGGDALVTYSGAPLAVEEIEFFSDLGVLLAPHQEAGSLVPWQWWRRQRGGQRFKLQSSAPESTQSVVVDELRTMPRLGTRCSAVSEVHEVRVAREPANDAADSSGANNAEGLENLQQAAVLRCNVGQGTLWLAPTSMLANDRIHNLGNLNALWQIRQELGQEWTVIEGGATVLSGAASGNAKRARATLNAMALQLVLLYLGALLALAWSFGPRWRHPGVAPDGHRGFLLGVGALHRQLGQLPQAAQLLHKRWLEYDPLARRRSLEDVPSADELTSERLVEWAASRSRSVSEVRMNNKGGER